MIDKRSIVPPSPPTSPRMSDTGRKIDEYQWQQPSTLAQSSGGAQQAQLEDVHPSNNGQIQDNPTAQQVQQIRPPLRSHKSLPYALGSSNRVQDDIQQNQHNISAVGDFIERVVSQVPQPPGSAQLQQPTFGGSAPASPRGRLTPDSPRGDDGDLFMEDDDIDFDTVEQEGETDRPPMTAAELRAHKRKMKRFRLTHNQTRFLMSEFARQAHPDAAHRERLSREIPGLGPRQVQVWFQNRRAKLKRLTTDDRERMMRSRALPADFDMTQALHSPFGGQAPNVTNTPVPSGTFVPFSDSTGSRPLTLDTYTQTHAHPAGVTPALGAFTFTPPQSATETMSPGSAASNASPFGFQTRESPRRQPLGHHTGYAGYGSQMLPRLYTHDKITRPAAEITASPLRTSMSYSGLGSHITPQNQSERTQSFSEYASYMPTRPRPSRSTTNPNLTGAGPYGLGFSYANVPNYQQIDYSRQASHANVAQPVIDYAQYQRNSAQLAGPRITSAQYPSAHISTPQTPQYSHLSGFPSQTFSSPYQRQGHDPQPQRHEEQGHQQLSQEGQPNYAPMESHPLGFVSIAASQQEELGDNSDGGVSIRPDH